MCYCFISVRYQQILFHLSQITPRRHTIRLKESKSNRKVNKTTTKTEYERLCQESLCEALRNFQASTNTAILEIPVSTITKQKPLVRSYPQTNSAIKCLDRLENTIKLSYVSRNSFAENKAEPMFHDRHEYAGNAMNHPNTVLLAANLIRQLSQPIFRNSIQIRGFKTHRTIASQLKRNPSFVSRFQQFFGECMLGVKIGRASNNNVLFRISVPLSKVDSVTTASKQRHETLNKLLSQAEDATTAVDGQKQRIKVAFAEGYLAANTEDKLGIAARFVKVISMLRSII